MRTIIATVLAVLTATALNNFTNPTPNTVTNSIEHAITEHASAQAVAPAETEQPAADKPAPETIEPKATTAPQVAPVSTCAGEITKYGTWNQNVAYNVMMAESSGNAGILNDNPDTHDYSVGCFQINLKGDPNLYSKHRIAAQLGFTGTVDRALLAEWLKNPANNVAVADRLYTTAGGWSDWKYTCQTKVQCY